MNGRFQRNQTLAVAVATDLNVPSQVFAEADARFPQMTGFWAHGMVMSAKLVHPDRQFGGQGGIADLYT